MLAKFIGDCRRTWKLTMASSRVSSFHRSPSWPPQSGKRPGRLILNYLTSSSLPLLLQMENCGQVKPFQIMRGPNKLHQIMKALHKLPQLMEAPHKLCQLMRALHKLSLWTLKIDSRMRLACSSFVSSDISSTDNSYDACWSYLHILFNLVYHWEVRFKIALSFNSLVSPTIIQFVLPAYCIVNN